MWHVGPGKGGRGKILVCPVVTKILSFPPLNQPQFGLHPAPIPCRTTLPQPLLLQSIWKLLVHVQSLRLFAPVVPMHMTVAQFMRTDREIRQHKAVIGLGG